MPRATWKGTITLGLLNIPVELFPGTSDEKIGFRQLCPTHRCPIQQITFCRDGNEPLTRDQLVKGFEVETGKFVVLTEDDIAKAALPLSKVLEIEVCVPESEIDPRSFHKPYIAVPPTNPAKAYALIHATLAKTGHAAIGRIALRTKQHIAAVRALGPFLIVHLMHWPDELISLDAFAPPQVEAKAAEVAVAEQLVAALAGDFDATSFVDQHRLNVMELIERRRRGEPDVEFKEQAEPTDGGNDIMALLQASLTAVPRKAA